MGNLLLVIFTIVMGLVLGGIFTSLLIPFLKKHQFKQFVREEGPKSHLHKTGTPSMGGVAILGATIISALVVSLVTKVWSINIVVVLITGALFGLIGFIDDYEKAIKKNNSGISPKQKIVMQVGFSLVFGIWAYLHSGDYMTIGLYTEAPINSSIFIPIADIYVNLGIFYILWIIFVMVAFSNAVNLTDGLDGLASSVTVIVCMFMVAGGSLAGYVDYPIVVGALAGGCLGFLIYNHYPAKIFMGDTGSMMIGGLLASTAIMMKLEILLALAGLVYVLEALSVIIQVVYFKKTGGKRFFKMAPLHHHFELSGLHETKVVVLFTGVTAVLGLIAYGIMNI